VLALLLPALGGAVIGPHGGLIDRAMKPLGGALRANAGVGDPCASLVPVADYDARDYSQADNTALNPTNSGTGGATYDLASGAGVRFRTAANCLGSSANPCFSNTSVTQRAFMTSASAGTWTQTVVCAVFHDPASTFAFPFGWSNDAADNYLRHTDGTGYLITGDVQVTGATTDDQWAAICWDMTDPADVDVSVNGATTATALDISGAAFSDPDQIVIGAPSSGSGGAAHMQGSSLGRLLFFNDDPGVDLNTLSQCLGADWGFL
jgi:hypothetical protein